MEEVLIFIRSMLQVKILRPAAADYIAYDLKSLDFLHKNHIVHRVRALFMPSSLPSPDIILLLGYQIRKHSRQPYRWAVSMGERASPLPSLPI